MTKYACNSEGVEALKGTATALSEAVSFLKASTTNMKSIAENNSEGLGPHYGSLINDLEHIENNMTQASGAVEDVMEILNSVAEGYQEVIDDDGLSGIVG